MEISKMTDQQIVEALLRRDPAVTRQYLFERCYPLFKSVYDKYYTDCDDCFEFINEIYLFILSPRKSTGKSKLETFGFRCTLTMWLKIVISNYCHQLFARRAEKEAVTDSLDDPDRYIVVAEPVDDPLQQLSSDDLEKIVSLMPNERYRSIIRYKYLEDKSHEETAMLLGLTMANYYNKHLLAKKQFLDQLKKEGLI